MRRKNWPPKKGGIGLGLGLGVGGNVPYLVRDLFSIALAAGSFDGTAATPGPGVRNVTDDGVPKLQITGGRAVSAQSDNTLGVPRIVNSTAVTRAPGVVMGTLLRKVDDFGGPYFTCNSLDDTFTYFTTNKHFIGHGTTLRVMILEATGGISSCQVGKTILNYDYVFIVVLKSTGAYYFMKGPDHPLFSLVKISPYHNTTPLYPAFISQKSAFQADNLFAANSNYLPAPLAYDLFTRADGAPGSTVAYAGDGGLGIGGGGLAWTVQAGGTVAISGNTLMATGLDGDGRAVVTVDIDTTQNYVKAALTKTTTAIGIITRYIDANNYIYIKHDGTNAILIKRVGGADTTIRTTAATYGAGRWLEIAGDDWYFYCYYHHALVSSDLGETISDGILQNGTRVGIIFFDLDSSADDFEAYARNCTQYDGIYDKYLGGQDVTLYDPLQLKKSCIISGFNISTTGAPDNYTVAAGEAILNGARFSYAGGTGVHPLPCLSVSGKSLKNPFVYYENGVYYMLYSIMTDADSVFNFDVGYATSTDCLTWTHIGNLVAHGDIAGIPHFGCWAPKLYKFGTVYYLFLAGGDGVDLCSGYMTSANITGPYVYQDKLKDHTGAEIENAVDPDIYIEGGVYYLTISIGTNICMYHSADITANRWTSDGDLGLDDESPSLIKHEGYYYIFHGNLSSADNQRILLGRASVITGPYTKMGMVSGDYAGQIIIDSSEAALGPINAPAIFWTGETWRLFGMTGTVAGGNNAQRVFSCDIVGNMANWRYTHDEAALVPDATNYVYLTPTGQLIHSAANPWYNTASNRGWLYLGKLTVNAASEVTAISYALP